MTPSDRQAWGQRLAADRRATEERLEGLVRTFDGLVDAADLEPPDDEHDPDGTTAYERAQVSSLIDEARRELAELDRAIGRLDRDDFGTCDACGRPIGGERLQAMPATTRCIACAARGR